MADAASSDCLQNSEETPENVGALNVESTSGARAFPEEDNPVLPEPNVLGAVIGETGGETLVDDAGSTAAEQALGRGQTLQSDGKAAMQKESQLAALCRWCLIPKWGPAAAKYKGSSQVSPAESDPATSDCKLREDDKKAADHELREDEKKAESNVQVDAAQCSFKRVCLIGSGSFARVHLVEEINSGRQFAMKIMSKHELIKLKQVDHVQSLKVNSERFRHPFLVQFVMVQQSSQSLYLIMELAEKGDIFTPLRHRSKFSEKMSRFYSAQILRALRYMQDVHQVVHRNVKPEACLLDGQGFCKLASFIFTKRLELGAKTYTLCGTPEYLAPEILMGRGHTFAVDWWSLGILTYEFLVGQPTFADADPMGIYQKILAGKTYYPKSVSATAKDLINRLLRADLSKRLGAKSSSEVASHKFFALDWQQLLNRKVPPNCEALSPDELSLPDDLPSTESEQTDVVSRSCDPFAAEWGPYISQEIP